MAEYRITIINGTEQTTDQRTPVATQQTIQDNTQKADKPKVVGDKQNAGALAMALTATSQLKSYVDNAINFGIANIGFETGSIEAQRKMQTISSAMSTASSVAISGIVGGIGTAGLSLAIMGLNAMISTMQNSIQIQNQKQLESESLNLRKSRLGVAINRSRGGGFA